QERDIGRHGEELGLAVDRARAAHADADHGQALLLRGAQERSDALLELPGERLFLVGARLELDLIHGAEILVEQADHGLRAADVDAEQGPLGRALHGSLRGGMPAARRNTSSSRKAERSRRRTPSTSQAMAKRSGMPASV